tara:strand:+ start:17656 stop:17907 length:252 start_codon:yes stop_codon:yes gene_type:complete
MSNTYASETETLNMDPKYLARFACLIQAIKTINTTAERFGIDCEKTTSWIKPGAIQRFIQEEYPDMLEDITHERKQLKILGIS